MHEKLTDYLANPVSGMILLSFFKKEDGRTTAKEIAKDNPSIAQATLYRHLKKMLNDGLIKIVKENRIRGVVEKVYELDVIIHKELANRAPTADELLGIFMQYMTTFLKEFQEYAKREDADVERDRPTISMAPLWLSNEELEKLSMQIGEILMPLVENEPTPERRFRNLGIIFTPPKDIY